ncbi:hypothetical protein CCHL11_01213 [Colletotrichum chlorophyti]|uniref:Uncharacterized protein n=1 Tax=Colletotrichum chlorophyti TaxID=708187 RepID=A0A1Q8S794_9PEZI|nr:hypothetical protein CCHL11_01213 [Colletotrichum chlorophyti]
MPSLRGLDITIVRGPGEESMRELPHPDSSSIHLRGPHPTSPLSTISSLGTPEKCKPTTTVYIPSSPGAQFHVRYSINRPPPDTKYLYFTMTMNGRHVVSWGIQSHTIQDQYVSHAYYEPDSKWHYRDGGVTYRREGVERRFFRFTPWLEEAPAAMDGGLIDLKVFRSKGRRRRAPDLASFRSQDKYGITSPTGGLVDAPQDLTYYDWVLLDPTHSPYATFRFFYRAWEHLKALNIVPDLPTDQEHMNISNIPKTQEEALSRTSGMNRTTREPLTLDHSQEAMTFSFRSVEGSFFEEVAEYSDISNGKQSLGFAQKELHLAALAELAPPPPTHSNVPQPSKLSRDIRMASDTLRPLPVLPNSQPSLRRFSLESLRAPSVTSSLLPYVDESSSADEFELGVARQIMLPSLSQELDGGSMAARSPPTQPLAESSSSEYGITSLPTDKPNTFRSSRSEEDTVMTRGKYAPRGCGFSKSHINSTTQEMALVTENFGNTSISEGEWLKRSQSPLRRKEGRMKLNELGAQAMGEHY